MASTNYVLTRIGHLEASGLVDNNLGHVYSLKDSNDRLFFVKLLNKFFVDVTILFVKMEVILYKNVVDFQSLHAASIKLRGAAACLGAVRMARACFRLSCMAMETRSRNWCLPALNELKSEYDVLKPHLGDLLQMEWATISGRE